MRKKTLWKDTFREITANKIRFIALLGIIILGTGFFVGVRAAAPDMRHTVNEYFHAQQTDDLTLSAPFGLEDGDFERLDQVDGIEYESYPTVDAEDDERNLLFRIYPERGDEALNQVAVVSGRLPENEGEIALDQVLIEQYEDKAPALGDTITLETAADTIEQPDDAADLNDRDFEVVGFVRSAKHIDKTAARGYTPLGKGTLDAIGVVTADEFTGERDNEVAITVNDAEGLSIFSDAYADVVEAKADELEDQFHERGAEVKQDLQDDARAELDDKKAELDEKEQELADGEQQLADGKAQLDQARAEYESQLDQAYAIFPSGLAPAQVADPLIAAEQQLKQQEAAYQEQADTFEEQKADAEEQFQDAHDEIDEAEADIDEIPEPNYTVEQTATEGSLSEYDENARRIAAIGRSFPWIFFLVAAMVSFTTMTRMVDEARTQLGTMKAFGYRSFDIARKFVVYAGIACLAGSAIGIAIGNRFFPWIIYNAYRLLYDIPDIDYTFPVGDVILTVVIALIATVGPAIYTSMQSLRASAAQLMRPKPPKQGEHILIERWTWFWQKLSFMMQITLRNLFRYKGRNTMTIVGILGCTALIITGFGISDSIIGVPDDHFGRIEQYDGVVRLQNDLDMDEVDTVLDELEGEDDIDTLLPLQSVSYTAENDEHLTQNLDVRVLDPESDYASFFQLADEKTGEMLDLPDDGAVITEKLAQLMNVGVGDELVLTDSDDNEITIPIKGIAENYIYHYAYVTADYYQELTGDDPAVNTVEATFNDLDADGRDALAEHLIDSYDEVLNVGFASTIKDAFQDTVGTLSQVTVVLIVAAALLAFIVLYSLQNINVNERLQELATIKVLGMYPTEVTKYLYRETLLLTAIGIALGLFGGYWLTTYIVKTVEVEYIVFPITIHWQSYLYSAGLTILFSLVVMVIIHQRLKRIDMVEALKGVE